MFFSKVSKCVKWIASPKHPQSLTGSAKSEYREMNVIPAKKATERRAESLR